MRMVALGLAFALALSGRSLAAAHLTAEQALAAAFPRDTRFPRRALVLTRAQLDAAARLAEAAIEQEMWTQYTATKDGEILGWAYLDTHLVRSLRETLLVLVALDGTVRRVEVLTFSEPPEYLPRRAWFDQFTGLRLGRGLALDRSIRPVTGATLTSRAATAAVRRVLAVHAALRGEDAAPGSAR